MSKIWIIDDDELYTYLIKTKLSIAKGFDSVENFFCPEKALNEMKTCILEGKNLPSVILLDINMPRMSGWEFLLYLKKLNINLNKTKVFIVSSSSSYSDLEEAKKHPEIDYFIKPLSDENIEMVRKYY